MEKNSRVYHLSQAIRLSLSDDLPQEIYEIHGYNSKRVRNLYNNICKLKDFNYLEVGCWKGASTISCLYGNDFKRAYIIDNWSEYGNVKNDFHKNLNTFMSDRSNDITTFNEDSFAISLDKIDEKIDIFLYDGNHSYDSQKKALTYFYEKLNDEFIYIVDDWNIDPVIIGTFDAIKELNLKIEFMSVLPSEYEDIKRVSTPDLY